MISLCIKLSFWRTKKQEEEFKKKLGDIPTLYFYKYERKIDSFLGADVVEIERKIQNLR